jgi:hypothetical protein
VPTLMITVTAGSKDMSNSAVFILLIIPNSGYSLADEEGRRQRKTPKRTIASQMSAAPTTSKNKPYNTKPIMVVRMQSANTKAQFEGASALEGLIPFAGSEDSMSTYSLHCRDYV